MFGDMSINMPHTYLFGDSNNPSEFDLFSWLSNNLESMNSSIPDFCNDTNYVEVWSDNCLNVAFLDACYPSKQYEFKFALGIWCVILGLIGFVGNLLTIIAIPYAAKKKK